MLLDGFCCSCECDRAEIVVCDSYASVMRVNFVFCPSEHNRHGAVLLVGETIALFKS